MYLIEANNMIFVCNIVSIDMEVISSKISFNVRIYGSILTSSFCRPLQNSEKLWQCRKKWQIHSDTKLKGQNRFVVS